MHKGHAIKGNSASLQENINTCYYRDAEEMSNRVANLFLKLKYKKENLSIYYVNSAIGTEKSQIKHPKLRYLTNFCFELIKLLITACVL